MEESFLHPDMQIEIFIKQTEDIVDLGITTKEFLDEYYTKLGKLMYGNVDAALLWLILLAKYLMNECNMKIIKSD